MELNKKAAYLQGLVDGLGVDESTKEGKIIKAMAALLGEMADAIAAMDEDLTHAYDQINDLSEELEDLIVKKAGLWLDSGDIFGAAGRGFERINVACPRSVLTEALERLARAVRECVK